MNEYVIAAKVKNNLLLRRILDAGHKNVRRFCDAHGLSPTHVGNLINMKEPAVSGDGEWRVLVLQLADILGVLPDELFTEEQMTARLKVNEAYIELSRDEARALLDDHSAMQKRIEDADLVGKLIERAHLNDNERMVLELRNNDETLDSVAESMDLSRGRIAQIESKALRKLRNAAEILRSRQEQICDVEAID